MSKEMSNQMPNQTPSEEPGVNSETKKTEDSPKSALIAAALIMLSVFAALLLVPMLIEWLAQYNEWLAYTAGALTILSFFAVFWLRARYQRKRDGGNV